MKKILIALSFVGLSLLGVGAVSAQYYNYDTSGYTNTMYSNYSYTYPQSYGNYYGNYNYGNYYGNNYYGGVGSYTIGCTTYYYNTRTGAQLYTQYICSNYNSYYPYNYYNNYSYPVQYYYYYTNPYPSYNYGNQYCTYRYIGNIWYPTCGY